MTCPPTYQLNVPPPGYSAAALEAIVSAVTEEPLSLKLPLDTPADVSYSASQMAICRAAASRLLPETLTLRLEGQPDEAVVNYSPNLAHPAPARRTDELSLQRTREAWSRKSAPVAEPAPPQ